MMTIETCCTIRASLNNQAQDIRDLIAKTIENTPDSNKEMIEFETRKLNTQLERIENALKELTDYERGEID